MSKLLSIIVPIYNVEPYLRQCLDSILGQTYNRLEIILVDDGSPDNCGAICDEYASKDDRVVVVHQKNAGVSAARNYGLKICTGEYIFFVDADDYILPELCSSGMKVVVDNDLDFLTMRSFRSGSGNEGTGDVKLLDAKICWENSIKYEGTLAWGCIMRKSLWEGIFYPEGRFFEDSVVAYRVLERVEKIAFIDKEYYFYRKTSTGTCQSAGFKPNARYDYILSCLDRLEYAEKKNVGILECRSALLKAIMSYFTAFYGMSSSVDDKYTFAMNLLKKYREMPYDVSLLNGKYKIYLWCAGRMDFVQRVGSKFSLWSKKAKVLLSK